MPATSRAGAIVRRPAEMFDRRIAAVVATSALLLTACGPGGAPPGGPGAHGGPPPVSVVPAVQRPVQASEEFSARIEAQETVEVRSRVAGTLEQVHFREGQRVARGAPLFSIDARPYAAEVERLQAQAAAARTQLELNRAERMRGEKLLPMQAISQQEMDQWRAAERQAEANLRSAQSAVASAQLNLGYTRIAAAIAGRVSRAQVTPGNLVGVGDPVLTTLVASDKVHVWFDASEASYLQLAAALRQGGAAPTISLGLSNEAGHPHKGTVDFIDNRLNAATGSIRVRAVLDNKAGLFTPGLSARVLLASGAPVPRVLVPERAIGTDQTRKVVMVIGANNLVAPREVKTGALLGGMRVIDGVKAGELVIIDGLQRAFPGAPVAPTVLKVDEQGLPLPQQPAAPSSGAQK